MTRFLAALFVALAACSPASRESASPSDLWKVYQTSLKSAKYVDLIGPELPLEAVGLNARTIGYEVLTRLGTRFHRHYVDRGD